MTDIEKPKRKKARDGAGNARKRPDGRWEIRVSLPGGIRRSVYGLTQTEADEKAKQLRRDHEGGRDVTKRDPTYKEFLEDWLKFIDNGKLEASTLRSYRGHVENHIVPALGKLKLSKVTAKHVDELLQRMEEDGAAPRTAQICRTVLNRSMKQALKWDMVTRNVVSMTANPKVVQKKRTPLTAEQLNLFLDHVKEFRLGPLYKFAMATGMRQGEILGLHWNDVDFKERTLAVVQAMKLDAENKKVLGTPKTEKSRRIIALPFLAIQALEEQRKVQEEEAEWAGDRWEDTGLIFTNLRGKALDGTYVTHALQEQIDAMGLPHQRFHDLRHAQATIMAKQRVPLNVRRDMLGHSQIKTTMDIYTHTDLEEFRGAASAIDAAFGVIEPGETPDEAVS